MKLIFTNQLEELARLAQAIEDFVREQQLAESHQQALELCLDEVVTNIISYAWPEGGEHSFSVELKVAGGVISVTICDDGLPFNPLEETEAPDLDASLEERQIGGLGVHFVRHFMDQLDYRRENNCNILTLGRSIGRV